MDINIEQAVCVAHDCASQLQDVTIQLEWVEALDKDIFSPERVTEQEKHFLTYLLEGEGTFAYRERALLVETRSLCALMVGYDRKRPKDGLMNKEQKKRLQEDDWEMLQHLQSQAVVSSAHIRVQYMQEAEVFAAERLQTPKKMKP